MTVCAHASLCTTTKTKQTHKDVKSTQKSTVKRRTSTTEQSRSENEAIASDLTETHLTELSEQQNSNDDFVNNDNQSNKESDNNDILRLAEIKGLKIVNKHKRSKNEGNSARSYSEALQRPTQPPIPAPRHKISRDNRYPRDRPPTKSNVQLGQGSQSSLRVIQPGRSQKQCVGVFISRLHHKTTPRDITEHICNETGLTLPCERLSSKFDTYASFLIRASPRLRTVLMDRGVWPYGMIYREFNERV